MRAWQKLVRNGNSTQVTIARPILTALGWLPGELVSVELLENQTLVISRFHQHQSAPPHTRAAIEPTAAKLLV